MAGRGRMRGDKPGSGIGGSCLCPNCNYKEAHQLGTPCYDKKCPKCGTPMTRGK